jgi:pimeloyl-ACP methyl ester carboxylesterase
MPHLSVNGVKLYYEAAGSGTALLFCHEFAGDYRSWEPQMRYFSRFYRCITFSARGYLPSDVPEDPAAYSQDIALEDMAALLDGLGIAQAHVCGLSMGSYSTLLFGLRQPERVLSLTIAGSGYGSGGSRAEFHAAMEARAQEFLDKGTASVAESYTIGPARVQFQNKDPRGWQEFRDRFAEHSALGSANTLRGVQARRPSIIELDAEMRACKLPALIILGDEDEMGIEGSLFMKRCMARSGLEFFPKSGHTVNLEEPERFNHTLHTFLSAVDGGRWEPRDRRSQIEGF